jgi:hypothetical protein
MQLLRSLQKNNPLLFRFGVVHFALAIVLALYAPFNPIEVLGLNSVIKPIKFALSIGIFSWTIAWFLPLLSDQRKARRYSRLQAVCLGFEQLAITGQALRGEKSHFNIDSVFSIAVFALMGVGIMVATMATLRIWWLLQKQKNFDAPMPYVQAARNGLLLFVVFSLFGGFISAYGGHTVGGADGGAGIPFFNWSLDYGDLRIAHFFGLHSLQLLPAIAVLAGSAISVRTVHWATIAWLLLVLFTAVQALMGIPLGG